MVETESIFGNRGNLDNLSFKEEYYKYRKRSGYVNHLENFNQIDYDNETKEMIVLMVICCLPIMLLFGIAFLLI